MRPRDQKNYMVFENINDFREKSMDNRKALNSPHNITVKMTSEISDRWIRNTSLLM